MTVLACESLDCGYFQDNPCVRGVDLTIDEGQVVALLGPNGAGKTTLLETLAGLVPRIGGTVSVTGTPVRSGDARRAVRAGMVLVPDDRALFKNLTTEQNLALAVPQRTIGGLVSNRRSVAEGVAQTVSRFPALEKRLTVKAGQLSGGEQQMLAISRALLQRPKVLLIDELSMGLAPVIVESILPVLREVAASDGTAVVLVEQHVRLALDVADRALVLVHGDIVIDESAASLAADPGRLEKAYLGG
ncbi:amino acid/amide ABC transporter ATP-binding protein 2, HAAT family [Gordonia malaquae]|jgi:branched-chain amino acid transport system ATP-binding protein|uniref:Putative ABC transporter ATP-binding protein n=1 Tax=Gordonia malaquae NBRC 108250 TaxID=1223542 RepID=M3V040_GORML|nr:ABC transporter ATP-binding protein [Gordonia malaquae]GAC81712.1 putative ABC transporter ATP-binding protein [Gordonia malaquae NBRC 108250]SEE01631.1 amino acid/amide ABC transporter ATP-binding protein 2, HAAT family [Gordonia malaquae]